MLTKIDRCRRQLIFLPIVLVIFEWLLTNQMFPIYSGPLEYDMDPAYQYLFNAVFLLKGETPFHIDHPGTPLQMLCAVVIFCTWLALTLFNFVHDQLVLSVTTSPELYLRVISTSLILLHSTAVYYLGTRVQASTKSIGISLLCQLVTAFSSILLFRIGYPSPESLLITITVFLLGIFSPVIFLTKQVGNEFEKYVSPKWSGLLSGLGVAVKFNFLPVLGLLFLFRNGKSFLASLFYVSVGLLLGVLPIVSKLPDLIKWFMNVVTHAGVHGSGQVGMFVFTNFQWHVNEMYRTFTFFYIVIAILIVIFFISIVIESIKKVIFTFRKKELNRTQVQEIECYPSLLRSRVPFVFSLICVVQTIFVLKHPGLYYMVPVLPIGALGFAWLINQALNLKLLKQFERSLGLTIFLVGLLYCTSTAINTFISLQKARIVQDTDWTEVQKEISKYPNATLVSTYRSTLPQFALAFGLAPPLAPNLGSSLNPVFNNFYMWDGGIKKLLRYGEPMIPVDEIQNQINEGRTVLLSTPAMYPDLKVFALEPLFVGPVQQLYKVKSVIR